MRDSGAGSRCGERWRARSCASSVVERTRVGVGRHLESRPQVEGEQLVGAEAGGGKEKVGKQAGTGGDGGAAKGGGGS